MIQQQRTLLSNLPTPPELQRAIDQTCEGCRVYKASQRDAVAENLKLQYHFGGKVVLTVRTAGGLVVYSEDDFAGRTIEDFLDDLPKDERRTARANVFERFNSANFSE